MLKIYCLKLDENFQSEFSEAMSNKYKDIASNKISKFAWYSLEKILKNEFYFEIKKDMIYYNEFNKPYILNSNLYFNISHSNNYVLIGISDSEVGVDIQKEVNIEKANLIIKRFNNNIYNEYDEVIDKCSYFTKKWVQMESYGKMLGTGIKFTGFEIEEYNLETFYDEEEQNIYYLCCINKNKEKESVGYYVL